MPGEIHVLVLIHGMWGNPLQLAELARIARETHAEDSSDGTRLHVLVAESISGQCTYDGIDWGGERVAEEIQGAVKALEHDGDRVTRFSATGFSLGGLIARYCITVLNQQGFFETIEPVNFTAIATPHCGVPRYNSLISSLTSTLGPKLLSRTGEQMYCVDKWSPTGRSLLVVMADPDREFYKTLAKFQHIKIYANAVNDKTVPYVTAAIEISDPFVDHETNGIQIEFHEMYERVISHFAVPSSRTPDTLKPAVTSAAWFKGSKASKPFLPPFLQFRFPLNILFYLLLPILIPLFIIFLIVMLSLASRSSRARIKELEREATGRSQQTLFKLLGKLENEIADATAGLVDDPDALLLQAPTSKAHPIISVTHSRIARWLNTLPIKKERAFFGEEFNSHAIIVSRDIQTIENHREGECVIRHWAESLVV
ncbi:hypothetical protein HYPSUDRAFT_40267 [Hypholoma sublateritium FD-334 SS-4]|uniref:DUF676 domain-containing protein n=1 Tax=Hypholoma sublateritium (strain FD-334 SS-4) TaxID=945553 RepID=A0A0D2L7L3_HYPSF|nr:hypothetical protein HYPSUDRAFT_40267 [Hypholoma sublateritium FD-334 SS-4]